MEMLTMYERMEQIPIQVVQKKAKTDGFLLLNLERTRSAVIINLKWNEYDKRKKKNKAMMWQKISGRQ